MAKQQKVAVKGKATGKRPEPAASGKVQADWWSSLEKLVEAQQARAENSPLASTANPLKDPGPDLQVSFPEEFNTAMEGLCSALEELRKFRSALSAGPSEVEGPAPTFYSIQDILNNVPVCLSNLAVDLSTIVFELRKQFRL